MTTKAIRPGAKTAIILFNLGGPDDLEAVEPFLKNLFSDPLILRIPSFVRKPLAWLIARRRAPLAQSIYAQMGGRSPIVPETIAQALALERVLVKQGADLGSVRAFPCMRYWHPRAEEVAEQVKIFAPDHILLLPLYPQFSTTTTLSSLRDWKRAAEEGGLGVPTTEFCCYPAAPGLLAAHAEALLAAYYETSGHGPTRVLFSAHGLPEKIAQSGDPYADQIAQSVRAIVDILKIESLDYTICYQSKVGPLEWLKPSTEAEIERAGNEKKNLVVVPIAFVSEHSETLVELDIEYGHLAAHHGVPHYVRVPTPSTHPAFIEALAEMCMSASVDDRLIPPGGKIACPDSASECYCRAGMAASLKLDPELLQLRKGAA